MEFINSRADVVRSINQRRLLSRWYALRAENAVPLWRGLDADELASLAESLTYFDVLHHDGEPRFFSRFRGARIVEAFGEIGERRYLDELLPPAYRDRALPTYRQVLATNLPVYTVADVRDRDRRIVHFERLLLPFSREGAALDRILASLETVSPEGAFENRDLMRAAPKPPAFALCATIMR